MGLWFDFPCISLIMSKNKASFEQRDVVRQQNENKHIKKESNVSFKKCCWPLKSLACLLKKKSIQIYCIRRQNPPRHLEIEHIKTEITQVSWVET